ncbi:GNAT family N-acetyltransferase [Enterovibrio nigricans]|uniref:Protein N-acetyltransferase, RimJ/RimL family n=1 Tax=Enterovibrio nigricans DSM 22720 TaxID=1121868 RepID=A0A1T4UGH5_9GAMM|nr:GNAT family N-acetyltransferase [Enterovibrio nigricans]PKF51282.1 N-acetyltransferase [Enterovibrio nigricans]SKA51882.1 Protein N-acetyltransferase, RimJ/RimL family [Enterovibrio nigricans DSM 22720]
MPLSDLQFFTPRLDAVAYCPSGDIPDDFSRRIADVLTPSVKQHLPPEVHAVVDTESAKYWLTETLSDATLVTFSERGTREFAGFILLYAISDTPERIALRLGYVVSEDFQGKGFASEIIEGLVAWCRASGCVSSLAGGAEKANAASLRVLEKNGFKMDIESGTDTVFLSLTF